ncbi:MAG: hypothetical protein ED859_07020 [Desulfuromonadales bacterium]|nr:MAG: hypothetical protein ED859_07020 [Desulfuromonadales bacterium]
MQTIPIALAEPDMILGRDVKRTDNPQGPPICGKGAVLTETLIERLRTLGIKSITVEGHPVAIDGEKTLDDLLVDLDHRFSKVDTLPLMAKLKEMHRAIIVRSMQGGS